LSAFSVRPIPVVAAVVVVVVPAQFRTCTTEVAQETRRASRSFEEITHSHRSDCSAQVRLLSAGAESSARPRRGLPTSFRSADSLEKSSPAWTAGRSRRPPQRRRQPRVLTGGRSDGRHFPSPSCYARPAAREGRCRWALCVARLKWRRQPSLPRRRVARPCWRKRCTRSCVRAAEPN